MLKYIPVSKIAVTAITAVLFVGCDSGFDVATDSGLNGITNDDALGTPEVSPASVDEGYEGLSCEPYMVDLSGTRLFGKTGYNNSTPMIEVDIPPGYYDIYLHYKDSYHPDQPSQDYEQWLLKGAYDDMIFDSSISLEDPYYNLSMFDVTGPTHDLPTHDIEGTTEFEDVYLDYGISWLKAVHYHISDKHNSIEPIYADFYPAYDYCDKIWNDYTGKHGKGKNGKGKNGKDIKDMLKDPINGKRPVNGKGPGKGKGPVNGKPVTTKLTLDEFLTSMEDAE